MYDVICFYTKTPDERQKMQERGGSQRDQALSFHIALAQELLIRADDLHIRVVDRRGRLFFASWLNFYAHSYSQGRYDDVLLWHPVGIECVWLDTRRSADWRGPGTSNLFSHSLHPSYTDNYPRSL